MESEIIVNHFENNQGYYILGAGLLTAAYGCIVGQAEYFFVGTNIINEGTAKQSYINQGNLDAKLKSQGGI